MHDHFTWRDADPIATLTFWDDYLHQRSLPPAPALLREAVVAPFAVEDPEIFKGPAASRDSILPGHLPTTNCTQLDKPILVEGADRNSFPFSAVGKLLFALVIEGQYQVFEGSAFVMHTNDERAVFTAGHCLFSERDLKIPRQWAQHVVFIPFYDAQSRSLLDYFTNGDVYPATRLGVSQKWYDSGLDNRYEYDLGCFCIEDEALRTKTGALGWMAGEYDETVFPEGISVGYPVGPEFEAGDLWQSRVNLSFQKFVSGFPHIRMHNHRFSRGASGGPVIVTSPDRPGNFYVVGLNAGVTNYGSESVFWDAPRFGHELVTLLLHQ